MILTSEKFNEVKKVQLDILLEFNRICTEHNIHYNLYFGTLLGAVRHEGFIPWDDDIDIVMTRKNYNKFLDIYNKEIENSYFVQNYKTDNNFFRPFTRIRKNKTIYLQRHYKKLDIHHGVFIDVFPFDNVYESKKKEFLRFKYLYRLRRLNVIKHFGVDRKSNRIKKKLQKVIDFLITENKFNSYITKVMVKRNNTGYLNHLTDEISIRGFNKYLVKEEDFLDSVLLEFEGHLFPAPRKYDEILTNIYGDYMSLPPEDERIPHHQIIKIEL